MKRIVLVSPGQFAVQDVPVPKAGPSQVLVRMKKVGVCGSDIHLYRRGAIGEIRMTRPFVIGHECAGEVVAVGPGVDCALAGRRVAVEPQFFCGKCRWCATARTNLCPNQWFLGLPPTDGAMQEYLLHPADLVKPLPDAVSDEAAVALEPLAVALHATNLAKIKPEHSVVILGTGVLGTCVLMILALRRGLRVVAVDVRPDRLERARRMGAAVIEAESGRRADAAERILRALGGTGADVVFECAGDADTLHNMCEVAAPGAHVVVVGTNPDDTVSFSSASARRRGLTMRFVRRSLNTLPECIRLAENRLIAPESIVTHTFRASEVARAFETVANCSDGVLKAVVDMEKW